MRALLRTVPGRWWSLLGAGLAGAGLLYAGAAPLAGALTRRAGPRLLQLGKGKFSDPTLFVRHRLEEGALLLAGALALAALAWLLHRALQRCRWYAPARGLGPGVLAFVLLNVWLLLAGHTALFWLLLFQPGVTDNFVNYQIKKNLLPEQTAPVRAVLLGNSQTRAALDEALLNERLGSRLWTTELHQPGCHGYDTSIIVRDLRTTPFQLAILYVSEIFIRGRNNGIVTAGFCTWRDLPEISAEHAWAQFPPGSLRTGLTGELIPLFRLRRSLSQRLLGEPLSSLAQQRFDAAPHSAAAPPEAGSLHTAEEGSARAAAFQKAGFERAAGELIGRGVRLLLITGRTRPDLQKTFPPEALADSAQWLAGLARRWPGQFLLLPEGELSAPTAADWDDRVHLNPEGQRKLTTALATYLEKSRLLELPPPPP